MSELRWLGLVSGVAWLGAACGSSVLWADRDEAANGTAGAGSGTEPACGDSGTTCHVDPDCCGTLVCMVGVCQSVALCLPAGSPCTTDADCCESSCSFGLCDGSTSSSSGEPSDCASCAYGYDGVLQTPQLISYTCELAEHQASYVCAGVARAAYEALRSCACLDACQPVCCSGSLACGGGDPSTEGCGACVEAQCANELAACAAH